MDLRQTHRDDEARRDEALKEEGTQRLPSQDGAAVGAFSHRTDTKITDPLPSAPARSSYEQTLAEQIEIRGIGLHSGRPTTLKLVPAGQGHGIRFLRTDLHNGARLILPRANAVTHTQLCTQLSNDHDGQVQTIEHLMAALHATGLSNVLIELDGQEVPILDGSSAPFVAAIKAAGLIPQARRQTYIRIRKGVEVRDGNRLVHLRPHADPSDIRLTFRFDIDFDQTCIGRQTFDFDLSQQNFSHQIGAARTFGFQHEIDQLRVAGKAQGGNLSNAIVIDQGQVQNPEGLRYADEFVRHKTLDAVGDLFIEGLPLIGAYQGVRAGHEMTNRAMRALMADPMNFERVQI